jgi:hypothetical protein
MVNHTCQWGFSQSMVFFPPGEINFPRPNNIVTNLAYLPATGEDTSAVCNIQGCLFFQSSVINFTVWLVTASGSK